MSHAIPPPRRKSCKACVKAKRRCDLLSPQCTRCFQKGLECLYEGQLPRRKHHTTTHGGSQALSALRAGQISSTSDPHIQPAPTLAGLPEFNFDAVSYETPANFNAGVTFMEFIPAFPLPDFPSDYPTPETSAPSEASTKIYTHADYEHVEDICDEFRVEQLNDDTTRVACAVAVIRAWHRSMAFSFSTPFLHRQLYAQDRPLFITHTFTSCLMFATKTKHTEHIVKPIIENYASSLIIENSSHEVTPSVALARVQALLLYMSIREPEYVERDLPILEKWLEYLSDVRDRLKMNLTSLAPTDPENWDSWVFWECVARTILAGSFFHNVHCLIARGEHPIGEWTRPHMWTASKRLWSAENSQEFYEQWAKKKPLVVCNIFLNNLLKNGSGDDVDAFASMLMVPTIGLASTQKWINDTRGRFEELDPALP